MEKGLTVFDLWNECAKAMMKGLGEKHILISDDDEGNGFHTLFYGIADDKETIEMACEISHDGNRPDDVVVLG